MTRYASKTTGLDTWTRAWEVSSLRPYRNPLPFQYDWRRETQYPYASVPGNQVNDEAYLLCYWDSSELALYDDLNYRARNSWTEKAKGSVGADLGLTLATWRSSLAMVTGACKALASKAERAQLYYRKKASSLYLEGIFGWVPLFQDIYNAYTVLSDLSPPVRPVKVRPTQSLSRGIAYTNTRGVTLTSMGVQVGGSLRCVNPNLALLERLGLVNPAAIAWDAVPYSFVINWVLPVGGFLKSLSDMVGWEELNAFTTVYFRKQFAGEVRVSDPSSGLLVWKDRFVEVGGVRRAKGIPDRRFPNVQLPSADLYKATVAFSLLDQKLRYPLQRAWRDRNKPVYWTD